MTTREESQGTADQVSAVLAVGYLIGFVSLTITQGLGAGLVLVLFLLMLTVVAVYPLVTGPTPTTLQRAIGVSISAVVVLAIIRFSGTAWVLLVPVVALAAGLPAARARTARLVALVLSAVVAVGTFVLA